MKHITKTILFTSILSAITIITAFLVQKQGEETISRCSYLDPITVDILAFLAAVFLVVEGIYRIDEHTNAPLRNQMTRAIRIAFGCAIITLHVMQFIHK